MLKMNHIYIRNMRNVYCSNMGFRPRHAYFPFSKYILIYSYAVLLKD